MQLQSLPPYRVTSDEQKTTKVNTHYETIVQSKKKKKKYTNTLRVREKRKITRSRGVDGVEIEVGNFENTAGFD